MKPPASDPAVAREALRLARRQRAAWLMALSAKDPAKRVSIDALLEFAEGPNGSAVRPLKLRTVLKAAGWSLADTRRVLTRLLDTVRDRDATQANVDIGWVVDGRASRRRIAAFQDAISSHESPWVGFPLLPDGGGL